MKIAEDKKKKAKEALKMKAYGSQTNCIPHNSFSEIFKWDTSIYSTNYFWLKYLFWGNQ